MSRTEPIRDIERQDLVEAAFRSASCSRARAHLKVAATSGARAAARVTNHEISLSSVKGPLPGAGGGLGTGHMDWLDFEAR